MNDRSYPKFLKIARNLEKGIKNGVYPPGSILPSERELMGDYKVSRNTAHNALDYLVKKGLVHQVQGKGTFTNSTRGRYGTVELMGFSEEITRRGQKPGSKILKSSTIKATQEILDKLNLSEFDNVFYIDRVRFADDKPIAHAISYVPEKFCPSLLDYDFEKWSFFDLLEEEYNLRIAYSEQTVKAMIAGEEHAKLLNISADSPLLCVLGITYLEGYIPIELSELYFRSDYYEFHYLAVR